MAGVTLKAAVSALTLAGVLATGICAQASAQTLANVALVQQDASKNPADRNQWAPMAATGKKSFEWDASKSRWGLKLDVEQQPGVGPEWKNVQAGAFFKLTPSLRVGAGVSLSDPALANSTPALQGAPPPRVHLETAFKF